MKLTLSQRRRSVLLALAGSAAVGAGLFMDAWSGQPLAIGWTELFLILAGSTSLLLSAAPVQRFLGLLLERSNVESAAVLAGLEARRTRLIAYGLWLTIVISLGEIALRLYEQTSGKRVTNTQYLWNVPVTHALTLVVAGALAAILARWSGARAALGLLTGSAAFAALTGWLIAAIRGLHPAAACLLAAGVAIQLARYAVRHIYVFDVTVRRTLVPLAVGLSIVAGGGFWLPRLQEARDVARVPAAVSGAPNVLFIVLDTVRATSLGLYGYGRSTSPNLDRYAARGVVFDHAIATAPWTLPSHGSMFTGRLPHELSGAWQTPIDGTYTTVAEAFAAGGYLTAGFVANTTFCSREFGLGRGFAHYEDQRVTPLALLRGTALGGLVANTLRIPDRFATDDEKLGFKSAADINHSVLRWLEERRPDRPFFVFLNYFDAHAPYLSPAEFGARFSSRRPGGDVWSRPLDAWTPPEIAELQDAYDATVAYLDQQLGLLFDELERRGDLARTLVVVTADHGEQFGEHGLLEHSNSLYLPLLHVPLIIIQPSAVPAGQRVNDYVSLRDLPATLVDLARLGGSSGFPGASLARTWRTPATPARADTVVVAETERTYDVYPRSYPARKGRMQSLIADRFHYIRNFGDGRQELYDLTADPDERHDLAPADMAALTPYRDRLDRALVQQ